MRPLRCQLLRNRIPIDHILERLPQIVTHKFSLKRLSTLIVDDKYSPMADSLQTHPDFVGNVVMNSLRNVDSSNPKWLRDDEDRTSAWRKLFTVAAREPKESGGTDGGSDGAMDDFGVHCHGCCVVVGGSVGPKAGREGAAFLSNNRGRPNKHQA